MYYQMGTRTYNPSEIAAIMYDISDNRSRAISFPNVPISSLDPTNRYRMFWYFLNQVIDFMLLPGPIEFAGLRNVIRKFLIDNLSIIPVDDQSMNTAILPVYRDLLQKLSTQVYSVAANQFNAIERRYARTFTPAQLQEMKDKFEARYFDLSKLQMDGFILGIDDNVKAEYDAAVYLRMMCFDYSAGYTKPPRNMYPVLYAVTGDFITNYFRNLTLQRKKYPLVTSKELLEAYRNILIRKQSGVSGLGYTITATTNLEDWLLNMESEVEEPEVVVEEEAVIVPVIPVDYAPKEPIYDYTIDKVLDVEFPNGTNTSSGGRVETEIALDTQAVDSTGVNVTAQPTNTTLAYDTATETVITVAVANDSQPIVKNLVDLSTGGTVDSLAVDLAGNPLAVLEVEDSGQIKTTEVEGVPLVTVNTAKVPTEVKEPVAIAANTVSPTTGLTPAQTAALQDVPNTTVKTTTYPTTAGGRDDGSVVVNPPAITDDKEFNKKLMYGGAIVIALLAVKALVK